MSSILWAGEFLAEHILINLKMKLWFDLENNLFHKKIYTTVRPEL